MSEHDVAEHDDAEFPSQMLRELAATLPDDTVSIAAVERRVARDRRRRRGARVAGGLTVAALVATGLVLVRPAGTKVTVAPAASPKTTAASTADCDTSPAPASKATDGTLKGLGTVTSVSHTGVVTIAPAQPPGLAPIQATVTPSTTFLRDGVEVAPTTLRAGSTIAFVVTHLNGTYSLDAVELDPMGSSATARSKAATGTAPTPLEETTKGQGVIQTVDNGLAAVLVTVGPLAGRHLSTTSTTRLLPSAPGCVVPSLVPGATVSFVADRTSSGTYVISALGRP